jgi:hypothetical protein
MVIWSAAAGKLAEPIDDGPIDDCDDTQAAISP